MSASFTEFLDANADGRFTDWLRQSAEPFWTEATAHRFTRELADDTLDDAVFRRYLIQDYAFLAALASLVGFAVGHAPSMDQKGRLARFLMMLTGGENDYFLRAFEALGVPQAEWRNAECGAATMGLADLFAEAAAEGGYDELMAVLLPVEWVYLAWAEAVADNKPDRFYLAEWITLHTDPDFRDFVGWMRGELDRRGPRIPPDRQQRIAALFRRACELEVHFFDGAFAAG